MSPLQVLYNLNFSPCVLTTYEITLQRPPTELGHGDMCFYYSQS